MVVISVVIGSEDADQKGCKTL